MVKSEAGKWLTYPAFVAHQFAALCNAPIPQGVRVISLDPENVEPRTLAIKERGKPAVALTRWVRLHRRDS